MTRERARDMLRGPAERPGEQRLEEQAERIALLEDMSVPAMQRPTVEVHRRAPQDLEWAHAGGRRFLPQVRPTTASIVARHPATARTTR